MKRIKKGESHRGRKFGKSVQMRWRKGKGQWVGAVGPRELTFIFLKHIFQYDYHWKMCFRNMKDNLHMDVVVTS